MTTPKTYSFHDALTALTEGRCKGIRSECWRADYLFDDKECLSWKSGGRFSSEIRYLIGQWTLVDETPKQVPWSKPEHVPGPVCWLHSGDATNFRYFVTEVNPAGIIIGAGEGGHKTWEQIVSEGWMNSTDGKTPKPCTLPAEQ